ncbi:hypothetical protein PJO48_29820, partial [Mycobacterium kansasii]
VDATLKAKRTMASIKSIGHACSRGYNGFFAIVRRFTLEPFLASDPTNGSMHYLFQAMRFNLSPSFGPS